jgi:fatty acid desaturase
VLRSEPNEHPVATAVQTLPDELTVSTDPTDQITLPRKFYRKSSLFGYVQALAPITVLVASLLGVAWLPPFGAVIAAMVGAVAGYHLTFVLHDACHTTLFEHRSENRVCGWIVGGLLGTTFPIHQRLHWIHHRHYRTASDPQGSDYNGLVPGRDRVLLHLVKPLFFLNFIEKFTSFSAKHHDGVSREEPEAMSADASHVPLSTRLVGLVVIIACQALLALIATGGGARYWGYPLWLWLLVTVGLFLSRVRSYLEHGAFLPEQAELRIARTHISNPIERNLLSGVLFNYHNEHHRWPHVPSRLLPQVHREITANRLPAYDFSLSYWASLRVLYAAARRSLR